MVMEHGTKELNKVDNLVELMFRMSKSERDEAIRRIGELERHCTHPYLLQLDNRLKVIETKIDTLLAPTVFLKSS